MCPRVPCVSHAKVAHPISKKVSCVQSSDDGASPSSCPAQLVRCGLVLHIHRVRGRSWHLDASDILDIPCDRTVTIIVPSTKHSAKHFRTYRDLQGRSRRSVSNGGRDRNGGQRAGVGMIRILSLLHLLSHSDE